MQSMPSDNQTTEPSPEFLAGYKLGGDDNLTGVARAVRGMALRRESAGNKDGAQALRDLEGDLLELLAERGISHV
jgi:hypothetical protein